MNEYLVVAGCDHDDHGESDDAIADALQSLHRQAHDGPLDAILIDSCFRDPCVDVRHYL